MTWLWAKHLLCHTLAHTHTHTVRTALYTHIVSYMTLSGVHTRDAWSNECHETAHVPLNFMIRLPSLCSPVYTNPATDIVPIKSLVLIQPQPPWDLILYTSPQYTLHILCT